MPDDKSAIMERQGKRWVWVITMLLIFIMASRTPLDTDLWWHLRTGEQTWTNHSVVITDLLSYTRQGTVWTNHSWLSQVGMYGLFHQWGYLGLSLGVALLATFCLGLVYSLLEGPPIMKAFLIILAGVTIAPMWTPRPQIVSLVMLALLAVVIGRYRRAKIRSIWMIIPILILWSNLHGGFVLGLIYLACVVVGETINHLLHFDGRDVLPWKQIYKLTGWGIAGGLVTAVNPNGIRMWWIPFQTIGVQTLQNLIPEWAAPDFHQLVMQPLLWMFLLLLLIIGFSGIKLNGVDLVLTVIFGGMALTARRNGGPFALLVTPVISYHMAAIIQNLKLKVFENRINSKSNISGGQTQMLKLKGAINLFSVFTLGLVAAGKLLAVSEPSLVNAYLNSSMPVQAVQWLKSNPNEGNLFNSYTWGGFLTWNLPEKLVFVDGRTDLFGDEIIRQWVQVVNAEIGWEQVLDRWQVRTILLEPYQPVVAKLEIEGWSLAYQDSMAVIYTR